MAIATDDWLSERFGRPVFTVATAGSRGEALADELATHAASNDGAFYQAKVDTPDVEVVRALCKAGMYPVEVNMTLRARPLPVAEIAVRSGVEVLTAGARHATEVKDVAVNGFRFSRFHLDPAVPDAVADEVKRAWVQSYLEGLRGEELLVAVDAGDVVGFLAALADRGADPSERVIDLVGVAPHAQGRGVGPALTQHFARDAVERFEFLRVGTQAANTIATRMYERLGFAVHRTVYTLHMHTGGGG